MPTAANLEKRAKQAWGWVEHFHKYAQLEDSRRKRRSFERRAAKWETKARKLMDQASIAKRSNPSTQRMPHTAKGIVALLKKAVNLDRKLRRSGRRVTVSVGRRKNIAAGFIEEETGIFQPIRASWDYDPVRAGEGGRKRKRRK
jgi:hypothetical protein